jgi:glucosamine--fructose-6-phosphate aminotransferase (isomerizing)
VNCLVEERRDGVIDIVKKYKNRKSFGFLGRGINTPVAYEGRLKLMELNYLPCISYPAGESKHGPISVIEKGFPVVAVAPNDSTHSEMISSIQEMKAREASIIAIIEEGDEEIKNMADDFIEIPNGIPELLTPIPTSVILQMFAYYMCVENGLDPDKPRNLAKSVTVK